MELDLVDVLDNIVDPNTKTLRDLRIDDRDFPEYANISEFMMSKSGLALTPFSRQLWMHVMLFQEYCMDCTRNKKLLSNILNIPISAPAEELKDHIQLLHYGRCPKCGKSKWKLYKEGKLNLYQELAALLGQRVGKCVTGDTRVNTTAGLVRIDSFFTDQPLGFSGYTGDTQVVLEDGSTAKIKRLYRERKCRMFHVETTDGHTITGTGNHPVWTSGGWVTLSRLQPGTVIPVHVGQNVWSSTVPNFDAEREIALKHYESLTARNLVLPEFAQQLTIRIAILLGYYVSEGSYGNHNISNHDPFVADECVKGVRDLLGGAGHYRKYGKCHIIPLGSNQTAWAFVDAIAGSSEQRSADKRVPEVIFRAPRKYVTAFLSALYEGDGCVNGKVVEYTTISLKLASEVQLLLANLGIISRIVHHKYRHQFKTSDRRAFYHQYNVRIEGLAQVENFERCIGFRSERKQGMLAQMIERQSASRKRAVENGSVQPSWWEKLPEAAGTWWKTRVLEIFGNNRDVIKAGTAEYEQVRRVRDRALGVSKARILALHSLFNRLGLDFSDDPFWEWAGSSAMYYTEVQSIELGASQQTYDFEITKEHRFLGNGLVNHNSTMLVAPAATYLLHKYMKLPRPWEVYGLNPTTLFGTVVAQTYQAAYDQLWLPVKTYIEGSTWFCIEETTPILLADGTTTFIRDVQVGTEVQTLEGSSTVDRVFDNGVQDCWELEFDDGTILRATAEHQVRCILQDGSLVWKTVAELTEKDQIVGS